MNYYIVRLTGPAMRDLGKLPEAVAAAVMEFIFGALAQNPQRVGKALTGDYYGLHSARRGEYRVVYRILDQVVEVEVVRIRHRKDVYRPR